MEPIYGVGMERVGHTSVASTSMSCIEVHRALWVALCVNLSLEYQAE